MKKIMMIAALVMSVSVYASNERDCPNYLKHKYARNERRPNLSPTLQDLSVVRALYHTNDFGMPVERKVDCLGVYPKLHLERVRKELGAVQALLAINKAI